MGCGAVQMPQNYIALFAMTEMDEQDRRLKNVRIIVKKYAELIRDNKPLSEQAVPAFGYGMTKIVEKLYLRCGIA